MRISSSRKKSNSIEWNAVFVPTGSCFEISTSKEDASGSVHVYAQNLCAQLEERIIKMKYGISVLALAMAIALPAAYANKKHEESMKRRRK